MKMRVKARVSGAIKTGAHCSQLSCRQLLGGCTLCSAPSTHPREERHVPITARGQPTQTLASRARYIGAPL